MRFIKTPAQAAHLVGVLQELASQPRSQKRKGKKCGAPVTLLNPKLISPGSRAGEVTIDFRHHPQCACDECRAQKAPRKRRSRNGSR